ncbi:TPA: imidazole glycerol phosphate synthase subunit HisF [bacterium]|nr:imidazole glycerol phosphate synthase subunit HisF [bacterium]
MYRPRIIPVLLLSGRSLVKSVRFKNHKYIGDPINAVRIFNDHKADQLVFLDINATTEKRCISFDFVKKVGEEANMPFSVGGGIRTLEEIRKILESGAEKVILRTAAIIDPDFVKKAALTFGSSTIVVCMDVKKSIWGKSEVWSGGTKMGKNLNPVDFAKMMEEKGAGELIVQSVDLDGTMLGYDIAGIREVSSMISVPVVALGGAGSLNDLKSIYCESRVSGLAAGSLFVYQNKNRGVLINYPDKKELRDIFSN